MNSSGFNLVGYATSPTGLGEDLRAFAAILEHLHIPFSVLDLPTEVRGGVDVSWKSMTTEDYKVSFFFMAPNECQKLAKIHPRLFTEPKIKIGYFLWEIPDIRDTDRSLFYLVDHIWCPTKFVRDSLNKATRNPVITIPLPVLGSPPSNRNFRRELNIPKSDFVALFAFDRRSTVARKNPDGAVAAFLQFANKRSDVHFVIKVNRRDNRNHSWEPTGTLDTRIKIVDEVLSPSDLSSLYDAADCYLSLHRSEGFGRTLIEAMSHRLPVISTNFSGPGDFLTSANAYLVPWEKVSVGPLDYPNAPTSWWANPSTVAAAACLEEIYKTRVSPRAQLGAATADSFSVVHLAKKYQPILLYYLSAGKD